MLNRLGVNHEIDRHTDKRTDGQDRQTKAIALYADKPISIKSRT